MQPQYPFTPEELTGRSRSHIVDVESPACSLHRYVVQPYLAMREAAAAAGIDLLPASSFRDFSRQLAIWNGKCRGERELLDQQGLPVQAGSLDADSLVSTILHWSALPGASRHHWGTDLDVFDGAAMPSGYRPQLVSAEFATGGVFARLDEWLAAHAAQFGFYRPYTTWRGGVQPEPWHLSHAPLATQALQQFSLPVLKEALDGADLEARAAVERCLPQILERYVRNVDLAPGDAIRATRLA